MGPIPPLVADYAVLVEDLSDFTVVGDVMINV